MRGVSKSGWMAFVIAVLVIVADQASKYWILSVLRLQEGQSIEIAGPLHLTGVWNRGVSFGLLTANHDLMTAVSSGRKLPIVETHRLADTASFFDMDDCHLTAEGYAKLAESIGEAVLKLAQQRR